MRKLSLSIRNIFSTEKSKKIDNLKQWEFSKISEYDSNIQTKFNYYAQRIHLEKNTFFLKTITFSHTSQ